MKKSKIIIPALGVLVLSTAASITGTVAWFTASRSATLTTDYFAVVNVDGDLSISVANGIGTSANDSTKVISPLANSKIGDTSFNPATKRLWNDTGDGTDFRLVDNAAAYYASIANEDLGADPDNLWFNRSYVSNSTTYYAYHAFSWKVTLSYTWGADTKDLHVFFDYATSTMDAKTAGGDAISAGNEVTAKGFRLAIIGAGSTNGGDGHTVVWSGIRDSVKTQNAIAENNSPDAAAIASYNSTYYTNYPNDATSLPAQPNLYMSGVTATNEANYYGEAAKPLANANYSYFAKFNTGTSQGEYALGTTAATGVSAAAYTKAEDGTANATLKARPDYLGTLLEKDKSTGVTSATFYCVAWYEGSDPAIINANVDELEQVRSSLTFYARAGDARTA